MTWHESLRNQASLSPKQMDEFAGVRWRAFSQRMRFHEPRHIAAYRGYGNQDAIWVRGRLLANRPYGGPADDDGWWDNLKATYQRWESDEIPGAEIELRYGEERRKVITDEEGYYHARFDVEPGRQGNDVVVARHVMEDRDLVSWHRVMLPSDEAEFLVISDMDDTVIHTGITNLLVSAQLTFLRNAKTRKPLKGVAALYRSLARGSQDRPVNPVVYVSNSAWNMYDLLRDFVDLNDLPAGPLLLRDIGLGADTSDHKPTTVRRLLARYPELPAVLIGDSGQHDAEIYAGVAEEFPDRIHAIYIRDVDPEESSKHDRKVAGIIERSEDLGIPFLVVADSADIAAHATQLGLLPREDINTVEREVEADQAREDLAGAALEGAR